MVAANKTLQLVEEEKWTQATIQWSATQSVLLRESKGVDFYNIEKPTRGDAYASRLLKANNYEGKRTHFTIEFRTLKMTLISELIYRVMVQYDIDEDRDKILEDLMRGPVSEALEIPDQIKWGAQSGSTFTRQMGDFMKPVIHIGWYYIYMLKEMVKHFLKFKIFLFFI